MTPRLLALAFVLAACGQSARDAEDRLHADALFRGADAVAYSPSCSQIIPLEDGRTLPVPSAGVKGAAFRIAYFHPRDRMKTYHARPPEIEASFSLDAKVPAECRALPPAPDEDLGAAVPQGVSQARYLKAMADYYAAAPEVAAAYGTGAAPTEAQRFEARGLLADFRTAAEPGLLPYYYRLNPDFWEWLRRTVGDSIPKA